MKKGCFTSAQGLAETPLVSGTSRPATTRRSRPQHTAMMRKAEE